MVEQLRQYLADSSLIPSGARVLCAYSGGADSTALLTLLHELQVDVCSAHLHHGMRPEADIESEACARYADSLGIQHLTGRANIPLMVEELGVSIEVAGRDARYRFLQQAALELGAQLIATGHTQDDHVETVILNLARGSGMSGLTGIPRRRGNIIRPILDFARTETRAFCQTRSLWFHDDPGNEDENFARVRTRLRIVPELQKLNPGFAESVARMASIVEQEDDYLNGLAARALEEAEIVLNGRLNFLTVDLEAAFSVQTLARWGLPIVRRAIRLICSFYGQVPDFELTELIAQALLSQVEGSFTLPEGSAIISLTGERMTISKSEVDAPFRYPLVIPGETESPVFGWSIAAFPSSAPNSPLQRADLETVLDTLKINSPLILRSAESGDRMTPLGFGSERKLSDLLGESKLTKAARHRIPIICDMMGPIWIPGVCISDRVAARDSSAKCVALRISPLNTHPNETVKTPRA